MARRSKRPTRYALVSRLRIETAVIGIDDSVKDEDRGKVERKAIKLAKRLPDQKWKMERFNKRDYAPFLIWLCGIDEDDDQGPYTAKEVEGAKRDQRYVLLKGNVDSGDGEVILQPWLSTDPPDLLSSDLFSDWMAELSSLDISHLSKRRVEIVDVAPVKPSDFVLFRTEIAEAKGGLNARAPKPKSNEHQAKKASTKKGGTTGRKRKAP